MFCLAEKIAWVKKQTMYTFKWLFNGVSTLKSATLRFQPKATLRPSRQRGREGTSGYISAKHAQHIMQATHIRHPTCAICKMHAVVSCCKLNNTQDYDEHLFVQDSTSMGGHQLPLNA